MSNLVMPFMTKYEWKKDVFFQFILNLITKKAL
jgi:hypothetical protein